MSLPRSFGRSLPGARLFAALALIACVDGGEAALPELSAGEPLELASEAGLVRLEVQPIGADALRQGENRLSVRVTEPDGSETPILTEASAFMPVHGHGVTANVTQSGNTGHYEVSGLALFMPGRWEVRLVWLAGGLRDEAVFAADVH